MPEAAKMQDEINYEKNIKALQFIEQVTTNADEIQKKVLSEILTRNAHVEYLKRHGLDGLTADRDTFKNVMPIVTYEDLQPDIHRIANGDTSPILCSSPISEFLTSSGTSAGERKLMPTIEGEFERRSVLYSLLMPVMDQYVPDLNKGKGMYLSTTPGGLATRPVLTSYYKSSYFKESPIETIVCLDSYQSMYSQLLCGLIQNNQVLRVGAVFASGFNRAVRFLQKHWTLFCKDIRTGTIDVQITDQSVRNAVSKLLEPNPKLADFIETECSRDSWQGIISRLWPNAKYIDVIVTGSMSQYIPTLDYYSNGLPLVCTMYASSECFFGLNLNPLAKPIPFFLPWNSCLHNSVDEKEKLELVELVDVKLGQDYELVVTAYAGLYRYRVGNVLRVAGFKNNAPQFNFICRKNVVLSIDADKPTSHLTPFVAFLMDYTSYASISNIPGHYVLYWELRHEGTTSIPPTVFEDCCLTIEESLNSVYRQGRVSESIGALEIKIVETGTFDKLMDYAISRGASINQYKTPRCVKFEPILELLNSRVLSVYFSPKCPKWFPGQKEWCNGNQN
ncbi:hypothetical protein MKX01_014095 [Papaver californicum]|nr:hypothetical protein MKX01_014095 [Papaver californicum]